MSSAVISPASNADAFARLARAGVIPKDLATTLGEGARLRNRIAHGYVSVDRERFWRELPEGLDALDRFATHLAAHLDVREPDGATDP